MKLLCNDIYSQITKQNFYLFIISDYLFRILKNKILKIEFLNNN